MELLTTVAAISSVAAVGVGVVTQVQTATTDAKLEEDVRQVNNAIAIYQTAGGSLDRLEDPDDPVLDEEGMPLKDKYGFPVLKAKDPKDFFNPAKVPQAVLNKLKSKVSEEGNNDREIMFLKGSVVDLRLRPVGMNEPWRRGRHLASYDVKRQRFEFPANEGEEKVQGFALDDDEARQAPDQRIVVFKQAKWDNWVWDRGTTEVESTSDVPTDIDTESDNVTTHEPIIASRINTALAPEINSALSQTALRNYPLEVTLRDDNPAGLTRLFYQGAQGVYLPYTGSERIEPGTTVKGYAASMNTEVLYDSVSTTRNFAPDPVTPLLEDNLAPTATYFALGGPVAAGSTAPAPATSRITLVNADEIPLKYRGGFNVVVNYPQRPQTGLSFGGGTSLTLAPVFGDFSNGQMTVRYRAVAQNTALFETSEETSKTVQATVLPLAAPLATVENNTITLTADTAAGPLPANYRIFYRFGADPGDVAGEPASGATAYTTAIPAPAGGDTLYARVYPPTDYKAWFSTSGFTSIEIEGEEDVPNYMGDYNVIVFNNLHTPNAVEGKSWTGGSWTNGNSFNMAQNYNPSSPEYVTVVGVSVGSGNPVNMNGNDNSKLVVTNASVRGTRTINGVGAGSSRLVLDPEIPAKTQAMKTQLTQISQDLGQLAANSTLVVSGNNRTFECKPNAQGIAIFNIQPGQLFQAQNAGGDIKMASGYNFSDLKGVLINVSGTTVTTSSSVNLNGNLRQDSWTSKIVWNFPAATSIDMAAQWVGGHVLAPKASIKTMNNFAGNVVCNNLDVATVQRKTFAAEPVFELAR